MSVLGSCVLSLVTDISCLIAFQLHTKMNQRNSPRLPHCLTLNIKITLFFACLDIFFYCADYKFAQFLNSVHTVIE